MTTLSILGGGVHGSQPRGGLFGGGASSSRGSSSGMEGGGERGASRAILRRVHGTYFNQGTVAVTPFRLFFNSVVSSSINSKPSGNPKYVYDSSMFSKYKRLADVNKTYDDSSFGGGNDASSVQSALRRVR